MKRLALLSLGLCLTAATSGTTLDQLLKLLGDCKCDEAFLLVSKIDASPSAANNEAARAVTRGAARCGEADPLLALSFSSLAARLAPDDDQVLLAHAEWLAAAQQRGEAAAVLERIMEKRSAEQSPRAWLLRGKLAAQEQDHDVVRRALTPLAEHPELAQQVAPLLEQSEEALRLREQRREAQAKLEARARARAQAALEAAKEDQAARDDDGEEDDEADDDEDEPRKPDTDAPQEGLRAHDLGDGSLRGLPGSIGRHGRTRFLITGLEKGAAYRFLATGRCKRVEKEITVGDCRTGYTSRSWKLTDADVTGLDFRVQFGDQPSRSLGVAQDGSKDQNRVSFFADAARMTLSVFDDSSTKTEVNCTIADFAIEKE